MFEFIVSREGVSLLFSMYELSSNCSQFIQKCYPWKCIIEAHGSPPKIAFPITLSRHCRRKYATELELNSEFPRFIVKPRFKSPLVLSLPSSLRLWKFLTTTYRIFWVLLNLDWAYLVVESLALYFPISRNSSIHPHRADSNTSVCLKKIRWANMHMAEWNLE